MPGVLDARDRDEVIRSLTAEPLDVLVIGGGITGAGAALDAAARGLRVGLVESRDLAAGTSSRSSKLIHGGLRYLEQGDFKLVREALRERDLLVSRLAPHLVRPLPFLYPLYRKVVERPYVGAGLVLYDAMEGVRRPVPHHRHLTTRGALRRAPALRPDRLAGAMVYYDAQVDDARYTVTVARTAARYGAQVLTRATAVSLLIAPAGTAPGTPDGTAAGNPPGAGATAPDTAGDGRRVTGAVVRDEETGRVFDVRAARVVVCAGVWSDLVHQASGVRAGYHVRMSKGVHLVMPRSAIDADTGMIVRTSKSVLFFIPWDTRWIVGTTDTEWSGDRAEPAATAEDVDYILREANRVLARPLTRDDVLAVYAGLRPLVAEPPTPARQPGYSQKPTTKVSREHVVDAPLPGLVSIAGGKFTTYRLMARDVVDAAAAGLPGPVPPSVTAQLPLLGADGLPAVRASARRIAADYDVPVAVTEHLIARYGSLAVEVLDLIRADKSLALPLAGGHPYLRAEVAYAVTHEGALHLEDVLARRVRLLIEAPDAGVSAAPAVAGIMAGLLGWNRRRRATELRRYKDFAAANAAALAGPAPLPEESPDTLVSA
ncbi:MAG TPA: glycerol-3-phosphate dehydrogenase/oxidase [Trebonia sp.]|nr:glycerol-3-phosphate dehydrogenase/oxidase [Trebonia sp.]